MSRPESHRGQAFFSAPLPFRQRQPIFASPRPPTVLRGSIKMDARHNFDIATATRCSIPEAWADVLIRTNSRLVQKVARQVYHHVSCSIAIEDLVQIGQIALIEAARNFVDRGTAVFSTYASLRIRGAMIDELRRSATISRNALRQRRQFRKVEAELGATLGRPPTETEMAKSVDMAIGAYRTALGSMQAIEYRSIDDEYSDTSSWFADLSPAADETFDTERRQKALAAVIAKLPEREQVVLQLFFVEECSLIEIGKIFDVGPARICQIKKRALDTMRAQLAEWR
jgi:RNA polymerase sigma factor for flagellar operon FliA